MRIELSLNSRRYQFDEKGKQQKLSYTFDGIDVQTRKGVILKIPNPQNAGPLAEHFIENAVTVEEKIEAYEKEKGIEVPGLPRVLFRGDLGNERGRGIVSEKVGDSDLEEKIKQEKILPIDKALGMYIQLLDIIDVLAQCGIVHCDITPDNIRVTNDLDQLFLIDFGIARKDNTPITVFYNGTPYVPECSIPPDREGKYTNVQNLFMNNRYIPRKGNGDGGSAVTKDTKTHSGIDVAMATGMLYYAVTGEVYDGRKITIGNPDILRELPLPKKEAKNPLVKLLEDGFEEVNGFHGVQDLRQRAEELKEELTKEANAKKLDFFYRYKSDIHFHPNPNSDCSYEELRKSIELAAKHKDTDRAERAFYAVMEKIGEDIKTDEDRLEKIITEYDTRRANPVLLPDFVGPQRELENIRTVLSGTGVSGDGKKIELGETQRRITQGKSNVELLRGFMLFEGRYQPLYGELVAAKAEALQQNDEAHTEAKRLEERLVAAVERKEDIGTEIPAITGAIKRLDDAQKLLAAGESKYKICNGQLENEQSRVQGKSNNAVLKGLLEQKLAGYDAQIHDIGLDAGDLWSAKLAMNGIAAKKITTLKTFVEFDTAYRAEHTGVVEKSKEVGGALRRVWTAIADIETLVGTEVSADKMLIKIDGAVQAIGETAASLQEFAKHYGACGKKIREIHEETQDSGKYQRIKRVVESRIKEYADELLTAAERVHYLPRHSTKEVVDVLNRKQDELKTLKEYYALTGKKADYERTIKTGEVETIREKAERLRKAYDKMRQELNGQQVPHAPSSPYVAAVLRRSNQANASIVSVVYETITQLEKDQELAKKWDERIGTQEPPSHPNDRAIDRCRGKREYKVLRAKLDAFEGEIVDDTSLVGARYKKQIEEMQGKISQWVDEARVKESAADTVVGWFV
ncbi:MAG: hypothetical protein Q7R76_00785 [Candidatus Woesearchaeota archaeon]|nr:hypothetical protein [Candidatus Woesearchaeota archaeon]